MTQISLSDAIKQLRDELRDAILDGKDQDIVITQIRLILNFRSISAWKQRLAADLSCSLS